MVCISKYSLSLLFTTDFDYGLLRLVDQDKQFTAGVVCQQEYTS